MEDGSNSQENLEQEVQQNEPVNTGSTETQTTDQETEMAEPASDAAETVDSEDLTDQETVLEDKDPTIEE